ncbi:Ankyrin repeat-containing protein [Mycena indigotica]|uniref:Ankyrin repeat-containing protein n=1 Tax=Mycena indigotica TaxID=2126181 RepID=A0A8H6S688_9AGAR|nr:Ankyrin repeat-containing protein [Mycena indigotica]KAF7292060.1 Ankyrin repeat-containing protein [Mycena indigotica]
MSEGGRRDLSMAGEDSELDKYSDARNREGCSDLVPQEGGQDGVGEHKNVREGGWQPATRPRASSAPGSDYASFSSKALTPTPDALRSGRGRGPGNSHRPEALLRSRPLTVHSPYAAGPSNFPRSAASRSRSPSRAQARSRSPSGSTHQKPHQKGRRPFPFRTRTDSSPFARGPSSSRVSHASRFGRFGHQPTYAYDPYASHPYYYYGYPYENANAAAGQSEREPFIARNPFRLRFRTENTREILPLYHGSTSSSDTSAPSAKISRLHQVWTALLSAVSLLLVALPHQLCLHLLLLRLPHLYFGRVASLFEDSNFSARDIPILLSVRDIATVPHLVNLRYGWDALLDGLLREWKAQTVVSALFLSTTLSLFQISSSIDHVSRTIAVLSLLCALFSICLSSLYIVHFGGGPLRAIRNAAKLAEEARQSHPSQIWNTWVVLALPAVWFAWSVLLFLTSITIFVWQMYTTARPSSPQAPHDQLALGTAVAFCVVLSLGLASLVSALLKFQHLGDHDARQARANPESDIEKHPSDKGRPWHNRAIPATPSNEALSRAQAQADDPPRPGRSPYMYADVPDYAGPAHVMGVPQAASSVPSRGRSVRYHRRTEVFQENQPVVSQPLAQAKTRSEGIDKVPFSRLKVVELQVSGENHADADPKGQPQSYASGLPFVASPALEQRDIRKEDWTRFIEELDATCRPDSAVPPFPLPAALHTNRTDTGGRAWQMLRRVATTMHVWNDRFFGVRGVECVIVLRAGNGEPEEKHAQRAEIWLIGLTFGGADREEKQGVWGAMETQTQDGDGGSGRGVVVRMREEASRGRDRYYCSIAELS